MQQYPLILIFKIGVANLSTAKAKQKLHEFENHLRNKFNGDDIRTLIMPLRGNDECSVECINIQLLDAEKQSKAIELLEECKSKMDEWNKQTESSSHDLTLPLLPISPIVLYDGEKGTCPKCGSTEKRKYNFLDLFEFGKKLGCIQEKCENYYENKIFQQELTEYQQEVLTELKRNHPNYQFRLNNNTLMINGKVQTPLIVIDELKKHHKWLIDAVYQRIDGKIVKKFEDESKNTNDGVVLPINDKNYDELINSKEKLVFVKFGAEWCEPCRMVNPILDLLATGMKNEVVFYNADVDHMPEATAKYGIRNVPTVLIYKNGEVQAKLVGAQPKEIYYKKIKEFL